VLAYSVQAQPTDRLTLAGVVLMVSVVAVIATLLPALRAGRIDPMVVLRE
jgi:ABC-type lipoprotein release transport system permease subunit